MESKMQFTVKLDAAAHLVRCTITGTIRVSSLNVMAAEALLMARAHGCRASLVDITDATAGDSFMDTFQFMADLGGLGLERSDFVAVVYAKDAESHKFAETVAQNRGWNNVRYFTDAAAAESWLRQNVASPVA